MLLGDSNSGSSSEILLVQEVIMCYVEQHSCICDVMAASKCKILHRRVIVCPSDVDYSKRPTTEVDAEYLRKDIIKECANFHKVLPYKCAAERVDADPAWAHSTVDEALNEKLRYMDQDFVTYFDHLNKTATAQSKVFEEPSISSGEIDKPEEYLDYRCRTGWRFNKLSDGTLRRVPDVVQRGREWGYDPTDHGQPGSRSHDMAELFDSDGGAGSEDDDQREREEAEV